MRTKALTATVALLLALCGCTSGKRGIERAEESPKPDVGQRFLCDEDYYEFETVVDLKTGVTYLVWHGGSGNNGQGGITALLNRDGTPVISEEVAE